MFGIKAAFCKIVEFLLSFQSEKAILEANVKPGIATIALRKYDLFRALDLAAEAGFAGVEIWGRAPHTPEQFDEEYWHKVKQKLQENELGISMYGSYVNPCSPDYSQKSADALKIAEIIGAKIIRIWAGNKEPQDADEELWKYVANSLRDYALQAEDKGLTLAMEMHGGTLCLTPEGCLRVIEEANAPNLKLNFQLDAAKYPDVEKIVDMVGSYVVNVHAQNYKPSQAEPNKWELTWIDDGVIDYDKVLFLLKNKGFDGYVEAEFLKDEFHPEEKPMLEAMRRDAKYLKELTAKYS